MRPGSHRARSDRSAPERRPTTTTTNGLQRERSGRYRLPKGSQRCRLDRRSSARPLRGETLRHQPRGRERLCGPRSARSCVRAGRECHRRPAGACDELPVGVGDRPAASLPERTQEATDPTPPSTRHHRSPQARPRTVRRQRPRRSVRHRLAVRSQPAGQQRRSLVQHHRGSPRRRPQRTGRPRGQESSGSQATRSASRASFENISTIGITQSIRFCMRLISSSSSHSDNVTTRPDSPARAVRPARCR